MVAKNTIILGLSQKVEIDFGYDLSQYTDIKFSIGTEEYRLSDTPSYLTIADSVLKIDIGKVTQLPEGKYLIEVLGYKTDSVNGEILTSPVFNPISKVNVISNAYYEN